MKIKFIGAVGGSVTGSCTLFNYPKARVQFLVDCGAVQGEGDFESANGGPLPFDATDIHFVLLTHAHLDHCGLLPRLYQEGFKGEVFCTEATAKLARLSLMDSAKYPHSGFSKDDVQRIRFQPIEGRLEKAKWMGLAQDLSCTFQRTAHIVGATSITIQWLDNAGVRRYMVMSGDLGNNVKGNLYQPLLAHRKGIFAYPDAIVVESTYGNRVREPAHQSFEARIEAWRQLIQHEVFDKKAVLVIPAFAMQRTQEVLLDLYVTLQRHFQAEEDILAPCEPRIRLWDQFEGDSWNELTQIAIQRAVGVLPPTEQEGWLSAIIKVDDKRRPYCLAPGSSKTVQDLDCLVNDTRLPYPLDITLDSPLAREMGAIIRQELGRRSAHKPDEYAHRNPDMRARLGLGTDAEVDGLLASLFSSPDQADHPVVLGPHTIQFRSEFKTPRPSQCGERGSILITGGGMCDGGPVLKHLAKLVDQKRETVLVQVGYMAQASLGARLIKVLQQRARGEVIAQERMDIGDRAGELAVYTANMHMRVAEMSSYYSGHADQNGLLDFVHVVDDKPASGVEVNAATVFINHGTPGARAGLKAAIEQRAQAAREGDRPIGALELPARGERWYDLQAGEWESEGQSQTVEQLLQDLLKEQIKTNGLLRNLLQHKAVAEASKAAKPYRK